jgi:hypothetical protein
VDSPLCGVRYFVRTDTLFGEPLPYIEGDFSAIFGQPEKLAVTHFAEEQSSLRVPKGLVDLSTVVTGVTTLLQL